MSNPINNHYVPQVYLKAFADSQKQIYQLKRKYRKISQKRIAQICYEPNYFTIQKDETKLFNNVTDPYHIEKYSFKKHENMYERILKKITLPSLNQTRLSKSEVKTFLEILITIKRRNPTVKKQLIKEIRNHFNSGEFKKNLQPGIEISRKIDSIDPEEYIENYIQTINNDNSKVADIYLSIFLGNESKVIEKVSGTLMHYQLFVYHAPPLSQFFTSDNPGFTVVGDIIVNYGGLSDKFVFIFPLSPKYCLLIDSTDLDDKFNLDKMIYHKHIDNASVEIFNQSTAQISIDKVFCYNKFFLSEFLKKGNIY